MIRSLPFALPALLALALPAGAWAATPRSGTFEFRLGNFRPDIDSEFHGAETPYADIFGDERELFPKVLASYTVFDRFVQLDVGLGTGWFRAKGKGLYEQPPVPPSTVPTGIWVPSGDNTSLTIIPTSLALTVRVDGIADRWPIPLELYGRVSLERYNWFVTDGAGDWSEKGATNGWSIAGGVGLLLNFIDPMLARELDEDSGINQTWLIVEVEKGYVDDFGSGSSWNLSDEQLTFSAGLRLTF